MPHIFVSHATADDALVTRIHDEVEAATGSSLWVDHKDIPTGANWQQAIDRALADASHMILVVSRASVTREEVMAEWRDALLRGISVLPAIIDDVPTLDIPARLRLIQPVNLHADWATGINQLASAITGVPTPDGSTAPHFTRRKITARPPIPRELIAIPMRGRETSYDEALDRLREAPTTIEGVGGLGKSRLAAEIVANSPDVDEAIWLRLGETTTVDALAELLRDHYAQPKETDWPALLALVKAGGRLLIVLDNAESIKQAERRAAFVERIEALHAAGAQILLTSRAAWPELRGGKHVRPTPLASDEAAAAVPDMARFHDARQADISARADDIAREGRNHPRLIEWAIGQMTHLPVQIVLGWMTEENNPDVQGALDDMIGRTLREMTAAEGDALAWALCRLNVTQGGFTWDAARALCILNDANDPAVGATRRVAHAPISDERALAAALGTLQRWQFVTMDTHGRFAIDPMAAEVVALDESAHRPHYDFYLALAEAHDRKQDYLGLDVESANLEAAFEWAMREDVEAALNLANVATGFLFNRGSFTQILAWDERIVAVLTGHPNRTLWANAQNSLGADLQNLPIGDRTENLHRALVAYQKALRYRTPKTTPLDYAMTQNNLGEAHRNLAYVEDPAVNLDRAIRAYEEALHYQSSSVDPQAYALTQNNLGNAYAELSAIQDPAVNLRRALAAYEEALRYRQSEVVPLDYAATQNNLGTARVQLSDVEDHLRNIRLAVVAFEEALRYWTSETAPFDYAMTQSNMGGALRQLSSEEDRDANLQRAAVCYRAALNISRPENDPLNYARSQHGLGMVQRELGDMPAAIACWCEAERYLRQTRFVEDADQMLRWIAEAEGGEDEGDDA